MVGRKVARLVCGADPLTSLVQRSCYCITEKSRSRKVSAVLYAVYLKAAACLILIISFSTFFWIVGVETLVSYTLFWQHRRKMSSQWSDHACAASDMRRKRTTVHTRNASHSPADKDVSGQGRLFGADRDRDLENALPKHSK